MSLPAEKPLPDADELPFWQRKAMKDMTQAEWESLCDGCGRCCLNKLQEEGTDRTFYTDVGCKLLDGQTCRCTDYKNRKAQVGGSQEMRLMLREVSVTQSFTLAERFS